MGNTKNILQTIQDKLAVATPTYGPNGLCTFIRMDAEECIALRDALAAFDVPPLARAGESQEPPAWAIRAAEEVIADRPFYGTEHCRAGVVQHYAKVIARHAPAAGKEQP